MLEVDVCNKSSKYQAVEILKDRAFNSEVKKLLMLFPTIFKKKNFLFPPDGEDFLSRTVYHYLLGAQFTVLC